MFVRWVLLFWGFVSSAVKVGRYPLSFCFFSGGLAQIWNNMRSVGSKGCSVQLSALRN